MEYVVVLKIRAEINSEDEVERVIASALLKTEMIRDIVSINATGVRP